MATRTEIKDFGKKPDELTQKMLGISVDDIESRGKAEEIAAQLCQLISYHNRRYYIMNDPVISDSEYDHLFQLLEDIEEQWPGLVTATSPTQRIGDKVSGEFEEVEHFTLMLSLDNSYDLEDLKDFDERVRKLTDRKKITYTVESKLDGTGIEISRGVEGTERYR